MALADSSAPAEDLTDELRSYPEDLVQSPLDLREARWTFGPCLDAAAPGAAATRAGAGRPNDPFASLMTVAELNPTVVLLGILGAAFLGGINRLKATAR